jgi:hypothetical protein
MKQHEDSVKRLSTSFERASHWSTGFAAFMALIPLLYLAIMVAAYHVDVPYWDQWTLVPLIAKSHKGALTFQDLWTQHNEHRLLFPRLLMITFARLSAWRIAWELTTTILFAVGTFAVIGIRLIKAGRGRNGGLVKLVWVLPAIALLSFSMSQWENWLWGWNLQIMLAVFLLATAIMLLTRERERERTFGICLRNALGFGRVVFLRCRPFDLAHWLGSRLVRSRYQC